MGSIALPSFFSLASVNLNSDYEEMLSIFLYFLSRSGYHTVPLQRRGCFN
jgi:hypothetical protein